MTAFLVATVGLAALGLCAVPVGGRAARWLHWLVVLAFAAAGALHGTVAWQRHERAPRAAILAGDAAGVATAALVAAVVVGPRAADLQLAWAGPSSAAPSGPLGAVAVAPAGLPIDPAAVQLRASGPAVLGRPLGLTLQAPAAGGNVAAPLPAELVVHCGDEVVLRRSFALAGSASEPVEFVPDRPGRHAMELRAQCAGATVTWLGDFEVAVAPAVLVLEPSGRAAQALRAQAVAVVEADALPAQLAPFAAVVVGQALPIADQERLATAIADGMGAFLLPLAFGNPGEPVRALLPLRPAAVPTGEQGDGGDGTASQPSPPPALPPLPGEPPSDETPRGDLPRPGAVKPEPIEVDKRAIAMVLLVDRSGSMGTPLAGGRTKMSYAKTSALRTAQALGEGDLVGLVTFGTKDAGRIELPMTAATDQAAVRAGIERLQHANEMTYLLGGARVAQALLQPCRTGIKHVVVVSDGEFHPNEMVALRALADRMRSVDRITLSVISIVDANTGPTFVRDAEQLARDGGGEFFAVRDPETVPAFVSAEVTRSLERVGRTPRGSGGSAPAAAPLSNPSAPAPAPAEPAAGREQRGVAVRAVAHSPLLLPAPEPGWPRLGSAIPGEAPLDAHVLLVAGDQGWPLLAFGNRGLGRVGAFAAQLFGSPGDAFRAEAAFPARLASWVQAVLPAIAASAPPPLLSSFTVTPVVPTPADLAALEAFAGAPPVLPAAVPSAPPEWRRVLLPPPAAAATALVGALLVLAFAERWLAARALRTGG